jgi:N-glycosylase/DNA lyase
MKSAIVVNEVVAYVLEKCRNDQYLEPDFQTVHNPPDIWQTLLFCILSSQVTAEKARYAAKQVSTKIPLFQQYVPWGTLAYDVETVLASSDVRYRFPRARAKQIAHSWFTFAQVKDVFHQYLQSFYDERAARDDVAKNFPGLGMKQASMLMRDIGFSKNLAVIDTHILWYAAKALGFDANTHTAKKYLKLEDDLLDEAKRHRVVLNTLDVAIWSSVKAVKAYHV